MHPFHAPAAVTALLALSPLLAQAADGDSAFAVRGSISAGSAWRTAERDANLIQRTNGSAAGIPANAPHGRNQDDGNLNFDKGETLSRVVKGFLHLAYRHDTLSAALGAKAWYDDALLHDGRDWGNGPAGYDAGRALSDHGFSRRGSFSGVALMEAWVAGTFTPAGLPLQVRVGNQYLDWGGRMSIGGGLSALQPVDLPAMRRPGATPDETRVPVTALSARLDASDSTRLEAFYQLLWRPTELDGCGTYFATADYVAPGCNRVMVGDTVSDPASVTGGRFLKRSATPDVANTGQFGLAGFFKLPSLSSELGVYAAQYHSRTPIASPIRSARVGGAPFLPGDADGLNAGYLTEYPEDIRVYGLTWVAKLTRLTVLAELSHRPNLPVQLNSVDLLNAVASNTAPSLLRADMNATPYGGVLHGYDRLSVSQLQAAATYAVDRFLGGDTLGLAGEAGIKFVHDLPDPHLRRYGRSDLYGVGTVAGTCTSTPTSCANAGYVTRSAWGYRLRAGWRYPAVLEGVNLSPVLSWAHDVKGWSADGLFNEGRRFAVMALKADIGKRYLAELGWTHTFGGTYNNARDRDFLAVAVGARF